MIKKFNYYLNLGNYYSENEKSTKSLKFKKIICKSSQNRRKKVDKISNINDLKSINNRYTDYHSCNNMIINSNRKTMKTLFDNKNYSMIIKKKITVLIMLDTYIIAIKNNDKNERRHV